MIPLTVIKTLTLYKQNRVSLSKSLNFNVKMDPLLVMDMRWGIGVGERDGKDSNIFKIHASK